MELDNIKIDTKRKIIYLSKTKKASDISFSVNDLYSLLMDTFDEPEYLMFDIPIEAKSKTEFKMINGWKLDKDLLKHLKGGTIK